MASTHSAPASGLRPVIRLATASPYIALRASLTPSGMVYLACVHIDSDVTVSVSAYSVQNILAAASEGLHVGSSVYFLAAGQKDLLFTWLRSGGRAMDGAD